MAADALKRGMEDRWILSKLNALIPQMTENMDKFELGVAAQKIYDFIWDDYCDWYIEFTKARLQGDDPTAKEQAQQVLCYVLTEMLKLLHPFMPFITEEIYQALPHADGEFLMLQSWPESRAELNFPAEEKAIDLIIDATRVVRAKRAELNVPPSKKAHLTIATLEKDVFTQGAPLLKRLAWAESVTVVSPDAAPAGEKGLIDVVTPAARIFMPLAELVDLAEEKKRLEKELNARKNELSGLEGRLNNPNFVNKAPAQVVEGQRARAAELKELIAKLEQSIAGLE